MPRTTGFTESASQPIPHLPLLNRHIVIIHISNKQLSDLRDDASSLPRASSSVSRHSQRRSRLAVTLLFASAAASLVRTPHPRSQKR